MDEADRLCDRIAIVDHGKLVALDSPVALKASVPGHQRDRSAVPERACRLAAGAGEARRRDLGAAARRRTCIASSPATARRPRPSWSSWRCASKVEVKSLSVQNTTLDDVFVHYTGRQLRDEQVKAYSVRHARPSGDAAMNRMLAIVERELRKFFRSPALMLVSMVFPLVQLIVLGNAFGGKIKDARLGVVDQDHGTQAVKVREALAAVRVNAHTFKPDRLRQRPAGHGRRAHRQARRRHHHSAAIFAPRLRAEPSAHRAGRRQHRQLHELDAGAAIQRR